MSANGRRADLAYWEPVTIQMGHLLVARCRDPRDSVRALRAMGTGTPDIDVRVAMRSGPYPAAYALFHLAQIVRVAAIACSGSTASSHTGTPAEAL